MASPFEVLTVTSLQIFEEERVDMAVIEVGMGGRLDATNILPHDPRIVKVSAMTMVDLDHTRWLGSTLSAIAREKAGIARRGVPFVLGPQAPASEAVVENTVRARVALSGATMRRGASVVCALPREEASRPVAPLPPPPQRVLYTRREGLEYDEIPLDLPLHGDHQIDNLSTALGIIECLQEQVHRGTYNPPHQITREAIVAGVAKARWPGRLEFIRYTPMGAEHSYIILLDGAHNRSSAAALRAYLDTIMRSPASSHQRPRETGGRIAFILSLSDSPPKTPLDTLTPLLRAGDRVAATRFSSVEEMPWVRPVDSEEVARAARELIGAEGGVWEGKMPAGDELESVLSGLEEALAWAVGDTESDLVVVAGSLYLVADFYRLTASRPHEFKYL